MRNAQRNAFSSAMSSLCRTHLDERLEVVLGEVRLNLGGARRRCRHGCSLSQPLSLLCVSVPRAATVVRFLSISRVALSPFPPSLSSHVSRCLSPKHLNPQSNPPLRPSSPILVVLQTRAPRSSTRNPSFHGAIASPRAPASRRSNVVRRRARVRPPFRAQSTVCDTSTTKRSVWRHGKRSRKKVRLGLELWRENFEIAAGLLECGMRRPAFLNYFLVLCARLPSVRLRLLLLSPNLQFFP